MAKVTLATLEAARLRQSRALNRLTLRVDALEAERAARAVLPKPIMLPPGFTPMSGFKYGKDWKDQSINAYLPDWAVGHESWGDPSLLEWPDDGSVIVTGRKAQTPDPKRWWRTGALQFKRPAGLFGISSALILVTDPSAVAAWWCYHNNIEIDFELIEENDRIVWSLAVHIRGADGVMRHNTAKLRAPWKPEAQVLSWNRQRDRIEFIVDGEVVAVVRPADMEDGAWNTTDFADPRISVEGHGDWSGWSYASGRGQMRVFGLKFDHFDEQAA